MARRIVITSGKGGVGKTTIAGLLGTKLAERGERVVLLDLDFGLNNLDVTLGVESKVVYNIVDVIEGRCRAKQALIECEQKNLFVVPSANYFQTDVSGQNVRLLIEGLSSSFDFVLIDCPAGIDLGFQRAVSAANEAIVAVTPTIQSVRDADKVLTILKNYSLDSVSAVINRSRSDLQKRKQLLSSSDVENVLKIPVVSSIPETDDVLLSKNCKLPPFSKAQSAINALSQAVLKNADNARDFTKVYGGLFQKGEKRRKI